MIEILDPKHFYKYENLIGPYIIYFMHPENDENLKFCNLIEMKKIDYRGLPFIKYN